MSELPKIDLSGRVALVTGASRGIGAAVAKAYAQAGAHVILTSRTTGALEEVDDAIQAAGGTSTIMPLNMLDLDKVDVMGPAIAEKFGRLDIAVGNAAMLGSLTPLGHVDAKEWARVMDLNVNANFRLIRTLDPLLRASDAGRMILVTSSLAQTPRAYWGAYAVSKAALESLGKVYAAETATTPLRVNMIDPGATRTAMRAKAYPGEDPAKPKAPEACVPLFLELAAAACTAHGEVFKVEDKGSL
ncbi:MAG TPA: SDR family NAD(P)-dependent oxidoreductase [Micavibrio sp.]